jgi:hypothetical protein
MQRGDPAPEARVPNDDHDRARRSGGVERDKAVPVTPDLAYAEGSCRERKTGGGSGSASAHFQR